MLVRVRLPVSPPYPALLVSETAVGTDQNLRYLYVVNEENKVVRHTVQLGTQQDGLQVIAEGLQPGERVIVNGLQHVHPGVVVSPRLVDMPQGSGIRGQGRDKLLTPDS
jgi:multidrug efflux system membrane fusion protein